MAERASRRGGASEDYPRAPYGKACINCVKSKTKCTASRSGVKCERCHRLNKDCQPSTVVRKKINTRKTTSSIASLSLETHALQEKLDDLTRLLQHPQPLVPTSRLASPNSLPNVNDWDESSPQNHYRIRAVKSPTGLAPSTATADKYSTATCTPSYSASDDYPLESEAECEKYLETYRSTMFPLFPVVFIPPNMTMKSLKAERPFLWLVIRGVCSKNSIRHKALGIEIRKSLATQLLFEGTKSFDLLLGFLVFAGWAYHYLSQGPTFVSRTIHLGVSLASDLGLINSVAQGPFGAMMDHSNRANVRSNSSSDVPRTIEERRVVVGLFYITSIAANFFQRGDPMRWTPYLNDCLHILEDSKDCVTDELLVYLVRAQLICNKAVESDSPLAEVPQDFYVRYFQSQIDELQKSIPASLQSSAILKLQVMNVSICIHERSLTPCSDVAFSVDPSAHLRRVESLWACLTATKSWVTSFNSLDVFPVACYPKLPLAIYAQMVHCMITLLRLSLFELPGVTWDRQRVLQELDLGDVLTTWAERMAEVPEAASLDAELPDSPEEHVWRFGSRRIFSILEWWTTKIAPRLAAGRKPRDQAVQKDANVSSFDISTQQDVDLTDFTTMDIDYLDDAWMKDIWGGSFDLFNDSLF